MAKVTFVTKEHVDEKLKDFKSNIDENLRQFTESNNDEHKSIRKDIENMKTTIDTDITQRIDDVEKKFTESLEEFSGDVEKQLDTLSKSILVENIKYRNDLYPDITNVKKALDHLLHYNTEVSFSSSTSIVNEMGTILNDVVLSWSYNKPSIVSQQIDGTPIAKSNRSYKYPSAISTDKTIRLTYNDGVEESFAELNFRFLNNVYYGTATDTNDSNVLALTKTLASSRERVINVNATGDGDYIVFALPTRMGTPIFEVNGFEGGFTKVKETSLTNTSGYAEQYAIWKSVRSGLGITKVTIK